MRNIKTREGFEFWDKLNALPRYAFLLSPSGNSVQKFEDKAMGNWIDVHEAQKIVDQAQDRISELRDELGAAKGEYDRAVNKLDALQLRLTAADQRIDELTGTGADRSPKDYAIEHAEYMAKSADHVLAEFQAYGLALIAVDEGGDDGEGELLEAIDSARQDLQEALVDLRSMVFEFRKRASRITPQ